MFHPTRSMVLAFALCSLGACTAEADRQPGNTDRADEYTEGETCLFGEGWDLWEEGQPEVPGLATESGWSAVASGEELSDLELRQIIVSFDFEGGPTEFEDILANTDNGEFLFRNLTDLRTDTDYVAWAYVAGDNLSGAIFSLDSDVPVARLSDPDIYNCTILTN